MRKHHKLNILAASIVAGSGLLLSACNGGHSDSNNSTVSAQHGAGATIHANNTTKLFGANSCLSGSINYVDNSAWYISGAVNITNTCATEQTLAGQTISFTSQDVAGNGIEAGTLNNWNRKGTGYKLAFTAGNGNQYIGEVTADNNSPMIDAGETITFSGGINLKGSHFNNALAQSSFAINGETPKPEPVTTGQLNVKIDTSAAGCSDTTPSKCNNLHITVTDVNGKEVKDFPVPEKFYGGIYEQPIDGVAPGSYTVSGSIVNSTTVSYTPTNPSVTKGETTAVTVKYNKVTVPTGKGDISLPNKVAAYTGDLQIQILNAKANNEVVNTYTIRQGETINTGDLPVSDTTHAYKVKMTTGIADPLKGEYFIESGLPALSIKKGQTTALEIPMKASTVTTQRQVTLAISGLTAGDAANVEFFDAAGKYSYVNDIDKSNGNIKYKIENNLNLGVVVRADGNNYESNPITSTGVIKANTTIAAKFAVKDTPPTPPAPTGVSYDYIGNYQGSAGATLTITQNAGPKTAKTAVITTNFAPKVAENCFTETWGGVTFTTKAVGRLYQTTVTAKDSTTWDGKVTPSYLDISLACGLSGGAEVVPGVKVANVLSLSVDGKNIPIKTLCSTTDCKDPGNGKVIAGYYANWSMYGRKYPLSNAPFQNINDLIYAFIDFHEDTGDVVSQDTNADMNQLPVLSKAALQYPYLKTSLSFGGWTRRGNGADFPAVAFYKMTTGTGADTRIDNFATQAVNYMRAGGFSGIDIDWEWWSNKELGAPSDQMIKLYAALRNKLDAAAKTDGKKYYLTIAVSAGANVVSDSQNAYTGGGAGFWAKVNSLVDHVNVMSYDMHGAFDTHSDFQAPLGMQANSPYKDTNWDINYVMNQYHQLGVSYSKLVMGIPAYGRSMYVDSLDNTGLYQKVTGTPVGEFDTTEHSGVFDYKCIVTKQCNSSSDMISSLTYVQHPNALYTEKSGIAQQPWGYGSFGGKNYFMTFDDVHSTVVKTNRAKELGLGGMMLWELDGDTTDPQTSLINAMKTELNK